MLLIRHDVMMGYSLRSFISVHLDPKFSVAARLNLRKLVSLPVPVFKSEWLLTTLCSAP